MSTDKYTNAAPPAPLKFARYRKIEGTTTSSTDAQDGPAMSRSRYRHRGVTDTFVPPIALSGTPALGSRRATEPANPWEVTSGRQDRVFSPEAPEAERLRRRRQHAKEVQEQKERQGQEKKVAIQGKEVKIVQLDEQEVARLLEELKRKDLDRIEAQLATSATPTRSPRPPKDNKLASLFSSRRRAATAITTRSADKEIPTRVPSNEMPQGIQPGGGGIVPGIDAPISAVNAGERRVLVRCEQSAINLPVTPGTTSADLMRSAANVMAQDIDPATAVLLESYVRLGLQRRVRRYEHIRDIMNSWDRDSQNALIIQLSSSPSEGGDLNAAAAPEAAPADVTVYMYYSQKPGKWTKRYITLLSSGQVFVAKKDGTKLSDKDANAICHLSDFDIYFPTPQQLRNYLKPPKKHCYAIRSQQKPTIFLTTDNFVHFFSTDEPKEMERWYSAVQSWRSWYLVNKSGQKAGQEAARTNTMKTVTLKMASRPGGNVGLAHKVTISVDENPYTIGTFKPLINMDRFAQASEPNQDSDDEDRPLQIPAHLRGDTSRTPLHKESKKYPPITYQATSAQTPEDSEFPVTSLLGRTYSNRLKDRNNPCSRNAPPTSSSASIHRGRTASMTSRTQWPGSSLTSQRADGASGAAAKREKPKPLLDFTPHFEEPNPLWSSRGKGKGVQVSQGTLLVDVATGPEPVVEGIGGTIFRREG